MIRVKEGEDPKAVAREINYSLDDSAPISAYTTNGIFSGVTDSVQSMRTRDLVAGGDARPGGGCTDVGLYHHHQ